MSNAPTDNEPEQDDVVVRPFADWLREQSSGRTHDELSEALHELVAAVRDTRKKGSLVLTIEVKPFDKGDALVVADRVVLKAPPHDRVAAIYYADDQGNLSREDPRQLKFEGLREVPNTTPATGELREIQ